ncbi:hypothetical protein DFH27DRAFT_570578 [Peziza echinospora]|nr:hypothetical protein DFH27DRAFT_570578 [Peziza echinospora]
MKEFFLKKGILVLRTRTGRVSIPTYRPRGRKARVSIGPWILYSSILCVCICIAGSSRESSSILITGPVPVGVYFYLANLCNCNSVMCSRPVLHMDVFYSRSRGCIEDLI